MAYDLGTVVHIPATFTDKDGDPVDPASITLTITLPDGTNVSPAPTPTHDSTGNYSYDYATTQYGHHSWRYSTNLGSLGDVFNVNAAASPALVSLADAKAHLNYYGITTTDDGEIRDKLRSATGYVNSKCGYSIPTSITESVWVPSAGAASLILTQWPVISVELITPLVPVLGVATPNVSAAVIDSNAGIVTLNTGLSFYGSYSVTYTAGRQDASGRTYIPDDLQELTLEYFKWLWETQRGASFTSQGTPGFSDDESASGPAMLPPRVYSILSDYVRPHV